MCSEMISGEPGKRTVHIVNGRGGYPQTRTGTYILMKKPKYITYVTL